MKPNACYDEGTRLVVVKRQSAFFVIDPDDGELLELPKQTSTFDGAITLAKQVLAIYNWVGMRPSLNTHSSS